jgi:hypothetical protein
MSRQRSIIPHKLATVRKESRINRHEARAADFFKKYETGPDGIESVRVFSLGRIPMKGRAYRLLPSSCKKLIDGSYIEITDDSDPYIDFHPGQARINRSTSEAMEGITRAAESWGKAANHLSTKVTFLTPDGDISVGIENPLAPLTATSAVLGLLISPPAAMIHPDSALLPL